MNSKLLHLASLLLLLLLAPTVKASHLMGGEITWDCLGSGEVRFTMELLHERLVLRQSLVQNLDRNFAVHAHLSGPVDFADGALANLLEQQVTGDALVEDDLQLGENASGLSRGEVAALDEFA